MTRFFIYIPLLILLASQSIGQTAIKGRIDLRDADFDKRIELKGEWEFYPFELLVPENFYGVQPLEGVKYVQVPDLKPRWEGGEMPDTGYGTYRLIVYLPSQRLYALEYQYIYSAAKFYFNKNLALEIGKVGTCKILSKDVYNFDFIPITYATEDTTTYLQILIQISDFSASKRLGITQTLYFGTYEKISTINTEEGALLFLTLGILFLITFYNLFIYLYYRKRIETLYLGLVSFAMLIRAIFTNVIFLPTIPFGIAHRLSFLSATVIAWLLLMIYYQISPKYFNKIIVKGFGYLSTFFSLFFIFAPTYYFDIIGIYATLLFVLINIYAWGVIFYTLLKTGKKETFWEIIAQTILILAIINDFLFYLRITHLGYLSHFAFGAIPLFLMLLVTQIIANIFIQNEKLKSELENKNEELENKVKERTAELFEKNKKLKELSVIAQETSNLIAVFDKNLEVIWINKSFEDTYKVKLEQIKGKVKIQDITNYKDFDQIYEKYLKKGLSIRFQSRINTQSGLKWLQNTLTPIMENGSLNKIITIESDITEIKRTQQELALKNMEIEASIRYARTIQNAFMPSPSIINKYFDSFIIYKPKEIVSGDFYWFKKIENPNNPYFLVSLVDSTGHGVPGAFMSLIGNRMIDDLVTHKKTDNPADILRMLNINILKTLRQSETNNTDGFDIVIAKINKISENKYKMTFASASMPFYIYKAENSELKRYKGNVHHIGGVIANEVIKFDNFEILLSSNDIIYFVTDGIINQVNEKKIRFGKKMLEKTLNEIAILPLEEQKQILLKTLEDWKGQAEQRDDITFFAFKMKF